MFKKIALICLSLSLVTNAVSVLAQDNLRDNRLTFDTSRLEEENLKDRQKVDLAKDLFSKKDQDRLSQEKQKKEEEMLQQESILFKDAVDSSDQKELGGLFQEQQLVRRAAVASQQATASMSLSAWLYLVFVLGLLGIATYVTYRMYL